MGRGNSLTPRDLLLEGNPYRTKKSWTPIEKIPAKDILDLNYSYQELSELLDNLEKYFPRENGLQQIVSLAGLNPEREEHLKGAFYQQPDAAEKHYSKDISEKLFFLLKFLNDYALAAKIRTIKVPSGLVDTRRRVIGDFFEQGKIFDLDKYERQTYKNILAKNNIAVSSEHLRVLSRMSGYTGSDLLPIFISDLEAWNRFNILLTICFKEKVLVADIYQSSRNRIQIQGFPTDTQQDIYSVPRLYDFIKYLIRTDNFS